MSYQGVEVSTDGQQHVPSAAGPMARSLSSLSLVTKAIIEAESWVLDPQLPPLPWRHDVFENFSSKPLVIGTMIDDGVVKVHPPIERVFRETVEKLRSAGHEIVGWDSSLNANCIAIMVSHSTESLKEHITDGTRMNITPPMAAKISVELYAQAASPSSHTCKASSIVVLQFRYTSTGNSTNER